LRTNSIAVALGLCAVMLVASAAPAAQRKRHAKPVRKKVAVSVSGAETGLVGIKLFDTGSRLVAVYGSPDEIQAVTLGGSGGGPGGGAAGGPGGRGLPGGGGPPGAPSAAGGPSSNFTFPSGPIGDFNFDGTSTNMQGIPGDGPMMAKPGGAGVKGGGGGGAGGGGGMAGSGGGGGAGGNGERVVYTRWVYNRNASKYGFIVDKFDHVVQCEAIGIVAGKAKTRRGITFGSSFAQIIKKYGAPDGYEIGGDNIVVRYLSKAKCAFRLSRLAENKPDVVTGIVVAAGKR
jgi:hypothetical protein